MFGFKHAISLSYHSDNTDAQSAYGLPLRNEPDPFQSTRMLALRFGVREYHTCLNY